MPCCLAFYTTVLFNYDFSKRALYNSKQLISRRVSILRWSARLLLGLSDQAIAKKIVGKYVPNITECISMRPLSIGSDLEPHNYRIKQSLIVHVAGQNLQCMRYSMGNEAVHRETLYQTSCKTKQHHTYTNHYVRCDMVTLHFFVSP